MLKFFVLVTLLLAAMFLQLLGFLKLIPLLISSPILFFILFIILHSLGSRNKFKGFK